MLTFDECCVAIVKNRHEKALNYAVGYARAGIGMAGHDAKFQALYILNNMSRWRGDLAKQVRESLKHISKKEAA